jgi:hypothetical protein
MKLDNNHGDKKPLFNEPTAYPLFVAEFLAVDAIVRSLNLARDSMVYDELVDVQLVVMKTEFQTTMTVKKSLAD